MKTPRTLVCITLAIAPISPTFAATDDSATSIENFAKAPEFFDLALSPNGRYLAATVPRENQTGFIVLDIDSMEPLTAKHLGDDKHVLNLRWVSDDRLTGSIGTSGGALEQVRSAGEIFGVNANGKRFDYLIGYLPQRDAGSLTGNDAFFGTAQMLDPRINEPHEALIQTLPFQFDRKQKSYVYGRDQRASAEQLNTESGRRSRVAVAPRVGGGQFTPDSKGFVRYFWGQGGDDALDIETFVRTPEASEDWRPLTFEGLYNVTPKGTDGDVNTVYFTATSESGTDCLYSGPVLGGTAQELACDKSVDIHRIEWSADGNRPVRVHFQDGRIRTINVAPDLLEGKLLDAIQKRFAPHIVRPVSWSRDRNRVLFVVQSDRLPGDFYLFDRKEKQARFLLSSRQWIDPSKMAERKPISYQSRDGLTIHGYLTLPPDGKAKSLPLVVLPHGGPIGVRDQWGWEPDAQLLASRGYAVLQVNFRGSGGYGTDFLEAGRKQWGLGMIDDIVDGTRWAIAEKIADPKRMCIYGASYGGYAALMSSVREPDLFQCLVGYIGVYDLETMARNTDITRSRSGTQFFEDYIGKSKEELRSQSPMQLLHRLKAPMLIVHGEDDQRAPFSEAQALRDELKRRNHPYEWMSRDREAHGFYKLENRIDFYETLLSFLDKHIGD